MDWYLYPIIVLAGVVCGFINTLAGSGSLISLPLLIFVGLPANVANGTNRVAILLQTMVAVGKFRQEKRLSLKTSVGLVIPAIIGAIIGAQVAVNLDEVMMRKAIGILMVVMLVVILVKPKRWLEGRPDLMERRPGWLQWLIFLGIGLYGGFIQAGVGIFLLAGLVLGAGYELVRANAVKNLIVLCFTIFALVVFILNDQVVWVVGLVLALGNMIGAWIAAKMAVERGAIFVRWLLIAVVIVSAAVLLGVLDAVKGLVS
jgi:uncharacterized membrane protein YfcA